MILCQVIGQVAVQATAQNVIIKSIRLLRDRFSFLLMLPLDNRIIDL
ncbi:hypothetical protein ABEZ32_15635 [Bacillus mycoides]